MFLPHGYCPENRLASITTSKTTTLTSLTQKKKETIISCLRFALPFNEDAWIPHLAAHFVWERELLGFWAIALEFGIKTRYMA